MKTINNLIKNLVNQTEYYCENNISNSEFIFDSYKSIIHTINNLNIPLFGLNLAGEKEFKQLNGPNFYETVISSLKGIDIAVDGYINNPDGIKIEPVFEKIESSIIKQLEEAKFTIWVTVAWFTNTNILNVLKKKHREGVNVQIIVSDDSRNENINNDNIQGIEFYKIPYWGNKGQNLVHNKFTIIDFQTVFMGSYNLTWAAEYNLEDISVVYNRKIAEIYSARFIELKIIGKR